MHGPEAYHRSATDGETRTQSIPIMPAMARLLFVDDDAELRTIFRRTAERHGFTVITAADGVEGLALAQSDQPDLVVLDVNMPRMDGRDVCRALKADDQTRAIPVLFLSARGDPFSRSSAWSSGRGLHRETLRPRRADAQGEVHAAQAGDRDARGVGAGRALRSPRPTGAGDGKENPAVFTAGFPAIDLCGGAWSQDPMSCGQDRWPHCECRRRGRAGARRRRRPRHGAVGGRGRYRRARGGSGRGTGPCPWPRASRRPRA